MVKYSWNWFKMDGNGLKWIELAEMVKTAHMAKPVKMAKNCQKWPKMAKNGQKQLRIVGIGQI